MVALLDGKRVAKVPVLEPVTGSTIVEEGGLWYALGVFGLVGSTATVDMPVGINEAVVLLP